MVLKIKIQYHYACNLKLLECHVDLKKCTCTARNVYMGEIAAAGVLKA